MPYFPEDDNLHAHPKVDVAGLAAMGLWTLAGSWSKQATTGGFIPTERVRKLGGTKALATRLVKAGLWDLADGGYQFHDWDHQAGNFDAATEKARRDAERERNRDRKRDQRAREKEAAEAAARHGGTSLVTPGGLPQGSRTPPVPVPSPKTDLTHLPSVGPDSTARAELDDPEFMAAVADVGIRDLPRVIRALERIVGPCAPAIAVDTARAVILLATKPVRSVEAYVEAACVNSPEQVKAEWRRVFDNAPKAVA